MIFTLACQAMDDMFASKDNWSHYFNLTNKLVQDLTAVCLG